MTPEFDDSRQAAVIPFRSGSAGPEICLIRRKDSNKWGIPKGMVDPGYSLSETAINEAWEEAGLQGELLGRPIGSYQHAKWGMSFRVSVYLMEVSAEADTWDEMDFRERRWFALEEGTNMLKSHRVQPLLARARKRIEEHLG